VGTTICLPIFQEGALLFMGDGHAAQGDGELTGDALDQALQRATSEMARWLEGDYKLNSTEAAMILGFAVNTMWRIW
jgi:amidase